MGFNLCYIGSFCEKLRKRMERHRAGCPIYVDGKKHFTTPYKILNEYGKENYNPLNEEKIKQGLKNLYELTKENRNDKPIKKKKQKSIIKDLEI